MRILKWLAGAIVGLACCFVVSASSCRQLHRRPLRRDRRSAREGLCPGGRPARWKQWSAWNKRDPQMQIEYGGPPAGMGAKWSWKSKSQGDGEMTFTAAEPAKRVAFDLYFPDFGTTSKGELRFEPAGPVPASPGP
jgi:hypothetical protein